MNDEIGHSIYIALGFIVLGIVLQFIMLGINIQHDISGVRAEELITEQRMEQHRLYDKYDGKVLIGDEVIEAIRYLYDTGVDILVNHRQNDYITNTDGVEKGHVSYTTTLNSNIDNDDPRYYNINQYRLHGIKNSQCTQHGDYFKISADMYGNGEVNNPDARDKDILQNWYPTQCRYISLLGYNSQDLHALLEEVLDDFINDSYVVANLDTMTLNERAEYIEKYIPDRPLNSEVTGIVFIDLENPSLTCEYCNVLRNND